MIRQFFTFFFSFFTVHCLIGQMTISTGVLTPAQYVSNLVGPGVTVSNVTYTGSAQQIGQFGGNSNIGFFSGGLVLSSGSTNELVGIASNVSAGQTNVSGITNTMNPTINDLKTIANANSTSLGNGTITSTDDGAILEFDFVPISNIVSFNFVFSSDEYLTWVNSTFNDIFGFFVSGPGISGPYSAPAGFPNGSKNLALIPGTTTPITISTIHPGLNSQYYVDNLGGLTHTMNGFTSTIPITFDVQCGETYHFKFAVADCQDDYLSTAVFLEDGSFTSPPVGISFLTTNGSDTIPEACIDADILFIRSACQSNQPLTVNFSVSGTATDNVDYVIANSPITLAPGQDTAVINFAPIVDGIIEGTESIVIIVSYIDAFGNSQSISGNLYLQDISPFSVNETDLTIKCFDDNIVLNAIGQGGSGVYTYDWLSSSSTSPQDIVSINQNGTYHYPITITDLCLGSITDTVTVIMNQTLIIDTILMGPSTCDPTGYVSALVQGQTTTPQHGVYYLWSNSSGTNGPTASVWDQIASGWYFIHIEDAVCSVEDSVFVDIMNPPIANFTTSSTSGCGPLEVIITNTSQNTNSYAWNFGNGNTTTVTNLDPITQTYTTSGVLQLIASQSPTCSDTMEVVITVNACGCTDPTATNYNPNATVDNGSCTYPFPSAEAPNVFTPDGDGANDVFFISTKNALNVELTILNRWGHKMFEGTSLNPAWNGKSQNGSDAIEGVYFYKYTVFGPNNQQVEGEGFLQLVR